MTGADRGAGTALAVGVAGALATAFLAVAALVPSLAARHVATATADDAALAAADTALGLMPGVPCERAAAVAASAGARLAACRQRGVVVRVRVAVSAPLGEIDGDAQAGPGRAVPPE